MSKTSPQLFLQATAALSRAHIPPVAGKVRGQVPLRTGAQLSIKNIPKPEGSFFKVLRICEIHAVSECGLGDELRGKAAPLQQEETLGDTTAGN